ncbi:MAG: hypothetical protein K7J46_01765 [Bryobacter sp.]|nr:hypothetical protein [Bryobacter sp. CoA8 C33]
MKWILAAAMMVHEGDAGQTKGTKKVASQPMEVSQIRKLAREAKTRSEHLAVAGHWEARARSFEEQAMEYERDADELASGRDYNPMRNKWPAMVQAPIERLRAKAMQARRAASESRRLMEQHRNLAERTGAATP